MSHDFEPEPHEKAMIDVMLKANNTPEWVYDFNKFLIEERTTGEIIEFIQSLLTSHSEAIRERVSELRKDEVKWKKAKYDVKSVDAVCYNRALDDILALLTDDKV